MAPPIGHLMISDLAAGQAAFQTVQNFGVENIAEAVQNELAVHNSILTDIVNEIATPATTRIEAKGGGGTMHMYRAAEHSRVPTQKVAAGFNLGYPIFKNQIALGWTDEWFRRKTVQELAQHVAARRLAHLQQVYRDLRMAMWLTTNYSHDDEWEDPPLAIPVKRLANADGLYIPPSPTGTAFDPTTHQHYLANATLTNAFALSLVNTVLEHQPTNGLRVAIHQNDRAEWEALPDFRPYAYPGITPVEGELTQAANIQQLNDIPIGTFGAAQVWIKPWAVDNYPAVYDTQRKPLRYRVRGGDDFGLFIAAQNRAFPWLAEFAESYYGFGVSERTGAAILFTAGGSYVDPVFPPTGP
jgi:hypothetical protein